MSDDLLERRLRTLYQVEFIDPDPPIASLRERIVAIPERRRRILPALPNLRFIPAFIAIALPLAALLGFALLAGAPDQDPAVAPGRIAFVQGAYGCGEAPCSPPGESDLGVGRLRVEQPTIVTLAADGGAPSPLLDVPGATHRLGNWAAFDARNELLAGPAVRWSPDGTRLAFRLFNDVPGIYLVDRDGGSARLLVELPADAWTGMGFSPALAWSPDGARIAYTHPYGGLQSSLYVVDTADGTVTDLGATATRTVAWSPDGTRIAFARSAERNVQAANITRLFVIDADGSDETWLAAAEAEDHHVNAIAWSPDGSRLAFELATDSRAAGQDRSGIYTVKPDGSDLIRLTRPESDVVSGGCCIHMSHDAPLAWSPDGSRVAGLGAGLSVPGIVVADADGSGFTVIGSRPAYAFDWSPDGSQLVYAVLFLDTFDGAPPAELPTDEWSSIHVIDADGSDDRWLAVGEYPDWSP